MLITAIGGDIAQAAAIVVRETFPDWTLFGIDMETRHGGARSVDQFSVAKPANAHDYVDWLRGFVTANAIDLCLPMSEAELVVLARADNPRIGGAELLWAGRQAVLIGADKLETATFLKGIGVPVPWTEPVTDASTPDSFPCILKARFSSGSKDVVLCRSIEDVRFFGRKHPNAVLQQFLPDSGNEVTCAVYRTRKKEIYVLQLLRRLVGGLTGWAKVIDIAEIDLQCRRIAAALNVTGAINIQLRMTAEGPRIFEINPRLSSTLLMRHLAGFSDVKWMIDEAMGRPVAFIPPKTGTILVRTQGAAILPSISEFRHDQDR
jgi:carbamoyl-phosphate synthase large subunit